MIQCSVKALAIEPYLSEAKQASIRYFIAEYSTETTHSKLAECCIDTHSSCIQVCIFQP